MIFPFTQCIISNADRYNYLYVSILFITGGDEKMDSLCEQCRWFVNDDETAEGFCDLELDEDEYIIFLQSGTDKTCRYFSPDGGEYEIVRRQN